MLAKPLARLWLVQFKMTGGMSRLLSLARTNECCTVSNAFEKSISKHRTYELHSSINVTSCIRLIKAHVVLPVGQKPNWSSRRLLGKAGLSQCWMTNFSARRDIIGVTDIGLYSARRLGQAFLGTGVTTAVSHSKGTIPDWNHILRIVVTIPASSYEHILNSQHGKSS